MLRQGGVVFFALPDRRFVPEDVTRPTTDPDHFLTELANPGLAARNLVGHVAESMKKGAADADYSRAAKLVAANASSGHHLHTFTTESLALALARARMEQGLPLQLVALRQVGNENIVVLRKAAIGGESAGLGCVAAIGGRKLGPTGEAVMVEAVLPAGCKQLENEIGVVSDQRKQPSEATEAPRNEIGVVSKQKRRMWEAKEALRSANKQLENEVFLLRLALGTALGALVSSFIRQHTRRTRRLGEVA